MVRWPGQYFDHTGKGDRVLRYAIRARDHAFLRCMQHMLKFSPMKTSMGFQRSNIEAKRSLRRTPSSEGTLSRGAGGPSMDSTNSIHPMAISISPRSTMEYGCSAENSMLYRHFGVLSKHRLPCAS
jgi:hypothetical protein